METIFDFVTVGIFIGIVILYFQYSKKEDQNILMYIWPSIGCATANYFGNKGFDIAGWSFIGVTLICVYLFIIRNGGAPDQEE